MWGPGTILYTLLESDSSLCRYADGSSVNIANQIPVTGWCLIVSIGRLIGDSSYETGLNRTRCGRVKRPASNSKTGRGDPVSVRL